ncbi:MAG: type III pantothenate kinase [Candidatus Cloacimonetes bacterium]|nr:type III pantothenate kinase [Candidatus Cloacimonadota bacterium]
MRKKAVLVVDIGNTHIVLGCYLDGKLCANWRLHSDREKTSDEYFCQLQSFFSNTIKEEMSIEKVAMSSVVPELTRIFTHLVQRYLECPLIDVTGYTPLGMSFSIPDPSFIGADLIVNAYSAWKKYETNCIICDFGTATTIQFVDREGHFHGTAIAPGVQSSATGLFTKAALLTNIQLDPPEHLLGTNTKEALLSGIILGHVFLIDGFARKIRQQFKHLGEIKCIATGGISGLLVEKSEEIDIVDKQLTLDGLYLISQVI